MNNLDSSQTETSSSLPASIEFRCPRCSKLYKSSPEHIYVERPEFQCRACDTRFSISLQQALELPSVTGEIIEKPKTQPEVGLKSIEENPLENLGEDLSFDWSFQELEGVEFKKASEGGELFDTWLEVLSDYSDRQVHQKFIQECKKKNNTEFAVESYTRILNENPHEKIAAECLEQIKSHMEVEILNQEALGVWPWIPKLAWGFIVIGVLFILLGLQNEAYQSLLGLGVGLVFFTFATRALFRH